MGLERTVIDPHGLVATFTYTQTYDNSHTLRLLSTIAMPDGGTTTFLYDANNLLTAINEPGNRTVTISRSGGRDLSTITNPDNGIRTFTYDSLHHLTNQQWGTASMTYSYEALTSVVNGVDWGTDHGRPTRLNLTPANIEALITNQVQAAPAVAVVTDANTNVNTYTLDGLGRINQLDRPGIPSETWQRDQAGQVTVYTDARGNATTNTFDYSTTTQTYQYGSGNGDLTRIDYPDQTNQQFKYESTYHHLTQRQDQRSKFATFLYDSAGNLTQTIESIDATHQRLTTQTWNGTGPLNGLLASAIDANNHTTTYQWDGATRRLLGMTEASGLPESRFATYLYDAAGNVTSLTTGQSTNTTYAHNVTTTFLYDGMRRVTTTTEGNGARTWSKLYDALGNVTQTTAPVTSDGVNRITSFSYDNRNHLIQTDEAVGTTAARSGTYLYDGAGNLLAETHGISPTTTYDHHTTTSYGYDALNRRTSVTEGFGGSPSRTTATLYDAAGNVTQITDANTHVTQFLYDALNRKTVTIDATPDHNRTTTLYDAAGNVTSVQAPLGRQTTYAYDNVNRRTEVTEAAADTNLKRTTTTLYDPVGNVTGVIYPRQFGTPTLVNLRTTYLYDALNRQTAMYDQAGQQSTMAYDATGNVTITTDVLGRQTTYLYDSLNRRVEMTEAAQLPTTSPLRRITTTVYDAVDNVTGVYSPLIPEHPERRTLTTYAFDALNRKIGSTDAAVQRTTTLYDAMGNVTGSYDEASRLTTFLFDSLNQRTETREAAGTSLARLTTTLYDAVGNVTGVQTPPVVGTVARLTSYAYDNMNRRTEVTESAHLPTTTFERRTTTTSYDALGNTTAIIDPDGNQTGYLFEALNRQTVTIGAALDPVTGLNVRTSMLYDAADNVTQMIDRDNRERDFVYDALNRRTREIWNQGSNPINLFVYDYDAAGQLLHAGDIYCNYLYTPDALGRTTILSNQGTVNAPAAVLNESFDVQDERTTVTALINSQADFTTAYNYDAVGRMTGVTQTGSGVSYKGVVLDWTADSQLKTVTRYSTPNTLVAVSDHNHYDALARQTDLFHMGVTQTYYHWDYDAGDRITHSLASADGDNNYMNDANDQLTSATYTYQSAENYAYDRNGNRTQAGNSTYTTTIPNRVQSDGVFSYTYDDEGNRRTRVAGSDVTTYTWDYRNRLVREQRSGGLTTYDVAYTYDIFDRRIAKTANSVTTQYVYDGDQIALIFNGTGSTAPLTNRLLYGPAVDQIFATETVGVSTLWPLTDQLGSVRDIVSSVGALVQHIHYDAYGNAPAGTFTSDYLGFTGREFEFITGLYYYRARYYDPRTGSFLSEDSEGFAAGDPNFYAYVHNNPTGATDPSGLDPQLYAQVTREGKIKLYSGDSGEMTWGETAMSNVPVFGWFLYWPWKKTQQANTPYTYIGFIDPARSQIAVWREGMDGVVFRSQVVRAANKGEIPSGASWFKEAAEYNHLSNVPNNESGATQLELAAAFRGAKDVAIEWMDDVGFEYRFGAITAVGAEGLAKLIGAVGKVRALKIKVEQSHPELPVRGPHDLTHGIFNDTKRLMSGAAGGEAVEVFRPRLWRLSKEAREALKHVEGHAAAEMVKNRLKEGVLHINYKTGPCGLCQSGIPELLENGQKLWVVYPDGIGYFTNKGWFPR
jgi:RHS repeat-associated protein